ncbi:secondary thiamine-phosphate synthase enzyme YjbQ [Aureimonas jatrophae]|jgi:secondary thiamine-phosphate synthase enzyme|uniref:Secondary thiamine-phosphate synthase enzyme n=1 Tax=Aureimonas jatrophae TaxID=1166073 RepID=A0A1H0KK33_9HYPH|nr:secondary thiamine-phosphate synthase enzyme YjbQ [Aureimonas jatrophae]MBB3948743.1 secondary thiamine-phosphate synthase enzyme [Aureimonas jatrophae]SDO56255.1 secondary thiamine-phosphate synthase enzyme [Aureimonas jatrophae]
MQTLDQQFIATLRFETRGRGLQDITASLAARLGEEGAGDGLLTIFLRHTSASLTIQENADPDVRTDLLAAFDRLAPETAPYVHTIEGPDDMPAHIKSVLSGVSLSVPVENGRMMLGTWQGVYLFEHRRRPHRREVALHFLGTKRR